ncbi:hypothetical protein AAG570_011677 [Ranatra chinensis]|uniref:Citrate transport protein n=1 Tax=Ranatra chinensis TaxID=642074 RepID=A0ABD0YIK1_9HEMI
MNTHEDRYRRRDAHVPADFRFIGSLDVIVGVTSALINNPVDVVKTRMQYPQTNKLEGVVDCVTKTIEKEGFTNFYKRTVPRLLGSGLDAAFTLMDYDSLRNILTGRK